MSGTCVVVTTMTGVHRKGHSHRRGEGCTQDTGGFRRDFELRMEVPTYQCTGCTDVVGDLSFKVLPG